MSEFKPLRILHCFRAPVGGVFRHVRDLAIKHHAQGHKVGILCDATRGSPHEEALVDAVLPYLDLGLTRIPISRSVGISDLGLARKSMKLLENKDPDILHGHGAKGGALARHVGTRLQAGGKKVARLYTPHGGSLHYHPKKIAGRVYFFLERRLRQSTDGLIFVSKFERDAYIKKVGQPLPVNELIYNGLTDAEFNTVVPEKNAADFLFIGTIRQIKGPDIFVAAFARAEEITGRPLSAVIVGDGETKDELTKTIVDAGLSKRITLMASMPAREAFKLGRTVVLPSRAESLPYVVLEALAAGRPVIASNVGGIHEIFDSLENALIPAGDVEGFAGAMAQSALRASEYAATMPQADLLKQNFSADLMAIKTQEFYSRCLDRIAV